jgi:Predicted transcriptional regulator
MAANTQLAVATHILTILALGQGDESPKNVRLCSEAIAHSIDTNPVVVRRLVAKLVKVGLVESQAGKGGGLSLACKPDQISLLRVYEALGDEMASPFKPHTPNQNCPTGVSMVRVLHGVFAEVEDGVRKTLESLTIADMAQAVQRAKCLEAAAGAAEQA